MTKKMADEDITITRGRAIKALVDLRRAELSGTHSGELLGNTTAG